jgi:mannose-6-phosphate isomerase
VPTASQPRPDCLSNGRTLLASNPHFAFERLELEPDSSWRLDASRETWLLMINGRARAGAIDLVKGDAVFAQAERIELRAGDQGVVCLVAYTGSGGPVPQLLRRIEQHRTKNARHQGKDDAPGMPIGAGR